MNNVLKSLNNQERRQTLQLLQDRDFNACKITYNFDINTPCTNVFLMVLHNCMRPNYFIGIRVPWALEDEGNWRATHRFASYLWVAGGLLLIILFPILGLQTYSNVFGATVLALAFILMGYSFYYYKSNN